MNEQQRSEAEDDAVFGFRFRQLGPATILQFAGELDLAHSDEATAAIRAAEVGGGLIVVDLTEVTFLDSTGLGVLAEARSRQHRDGGDRLSFIGSRHEAVIQVLELTDTIEMFR
jgi:anti-sigma B factor antagonist